MVKAAHASGKYKYNNQLTGITEVYAQNGQISICIVTCFAVFHERYIQSSNVLQWIVGTITLIIIIIIIIVIALIIVIFSSIFIVVVIIVILPNPIKVIL